MVFSTLHKFFNLFSRERRRVTSCKWYQTNQHKNAHRPVYMFVKYH